MQLASAPPSDSTGRSGGLGVVDWGRGRVRHTARPLFGMFALRHSEVRPARLGGRLRLGAQLRLRLNGQARLGRSIPEEPPSLYKGYVTECRLESCELPRRSIAQGSKIPRGASAAALLPPLHLYPSLLSHDLHRAPVMSLSQIPVPLRDARLFDAIQSGSADWKHQLFQEYLGLVRGLLIKSMGPQAEVDDLVAEVFVGLFESAGNIRSAAGLRSYVVSVTMNTARREFRRRKRFNLFFLRDEGQEIAERTASTDDPKAKAALLQLHRILEGLDHEERLIFVLHVLEELPLQEAAANLSVSLSTAKRRLKRANERIRRRVVSNPLLSEFVRERGAPAAGLELEETQGGPVGGVETPDGRPV